MLKLSARLRAAELGLLCVGLPSGISIMAAEAAQVVITLRPSALAFYDVTARNWKAEAGDYRIEVGTSSRDIRLQRLVSMRAERRFDHL
jgi:hypothetical protein